MNITELSVSYQHHRIIHHPLSLILYSTNPAMLINDELTMKSLMRSLAYGRAGLFFVASDDCEFSHHPLHMIASLPFD